MTYAEMLRANGATEEDIKVLDHPAARKAFDAQQAAWQTRFSEHDARTNEWYQTVTGLQEETNRKAVKSAAEAARLKAAILAARDTGLAEVAGIDLDAPATAAATNPASPTFDPSKYISAEQLTQVAEREGDAMAAIQDIPEEHRDLFPGQKLNWRELRREAVSRRMSFEALWSERYNVPAARQKAAETRQTAHDDKIRKEAEDRVRTEMASKYGDPNVRPLMPSNSPLAPRPAAGRDKQPWESGDRSNERVQKVLTKIYSGAPN